MRPLRPVALQRISPLVRWPPMVLRRRYSGCVNSNDSIPDGAAAGRDPQSLSAARPTASAGFGSPGSDSTVRRIDLNDALIRHPEATFFMRASGGAMHEAGIDNGDVLLVDRALTPSHGNVVIADVDGERVCRRLWKQGDSIKLQAADGVTRDIHPNEAAPIVFWGVVSTVIKSLLG